MPAPDYEHRLDVLEQQGVENKNRLLHVERTVDTIGKQVGDLGGKIDTVIHAVTTVSARPQFDFIKVLTIIGGCIVVFTAVTSGITYIASNINAPAIVENKLRTEFLRERLDNGWYKPATHMQIRAPGGAVIPGGQ